MVSETNKQTKVSAHDVEIAKQLVLNDIQQAQLFTLCFMDLSARIAREAAEAVILLLRKKALEAESVGELMDSLELPPLPEEETDDRNNG